ncbi:hypothetical protein C8R43DRAFT_1109610 [Mycena crocata]|nr:hypothetical protein C8R43DRAFT_1109610 [Mycena crocata]
MADYTYRVYGFLLNEDYLLKVALKSNLGTDEDDWQKTCSRGRAAEEILSSHQIYPYIVAGVMVKGNVRMCAAVASEYYKDRMPMPLRETIEKLKKMMKTDKEPRWYVHC